MAKVVHDGVARPALLDLPADPHPGGYGGRAVVELAVAEAFDDVAGIAVMVDQPCTASWQCP